MNPETWFAVQSSLGRQALTFTTTELVTFSHANSPGRVVVHDRGLSKMGRTPSDTKEQVM